MRVLHVQKAKGVAGSERHLLSLLPGLRVRDVDATMAVVEAPGGERFVDALHAVDVPTVTLRAGPDLDATLLPRIVTLVRRLRPDIVHTHLIHADVYGQAAARLGRAIGVRTIHGATAEFARQPFRAAAMLAGRLASRTIAISDYAARYAVETGIAPRDRLRVVPYGVDPARWVSSSEGRERARAAFGVAPEEIVVGVASRLIPNKGHDFLLRGVAAARIELPALRLLVAGDGPLRDALELEARPQGDAVTFLGYLDGERVMEFMHACDVVAFLTLPALGEGFGLAALEAAAAARPVVATDIASLPEIVVDGTTGVLVDPGDVAQLSEALVRLGRDTELRVRMGNAARDRACTRFPVARMVADTIGVYEEVLHLS